MSEKKVHKGDRLELLELIRQLKATVRTLEEGGAGGQGKPDGLAEGIATALGKMVPGLGKIIQTASQSPEFREKRSSIDEEVRRKLKEQPLGRASSGLTGGTNSRRIGIPSAPSARIKSPRRTVRLNAGSWSVRPGGMKVAASWHAWRLSWSRPIHPSTASMAPAPMSSSSWMSCRGWALSKATRGPKQLPTVCWQI